MALVEFGKNLFTKVARYYYSIAKQLKVVVKTKLTMEFPIYHQISGSFVLTWPTVLTIVDDCYMLCLLTALTNVESRSLLAGS